MIVQLAIRTAKGLLQKVGVDRAVFYSVLQSIATLTIGPLTALLIATNFSPELQGYYYTFGSFSSLQVLAELGIGQAIIQFASHEWSKLSLTAEKGITGDADAFSRLVSLGRISLKWYSIAAVIFVGIMLAGGNSFFVTAEGLSIEWLGPWMTFSLVIGINLVLLPVFYMLQGCNQVAQFWLYRLVLQILNGIVLWASILMGAKLWSLSIAGFACIVWSILFLWRQYPHVIRLMFSKPTGPQINWSREVWPMQWRVALSWMSSSFTSQLFAPILFRAAGPSIAGRAGLTITLSNALVSLAGSWVNTKAPRFGILIAQRNFKELDRLFRQAFVISTAVASAGALTAWAGIWLFNLANSSLAERVLSPLPAAMLLLASVITTMVTSLAIYLRAHKKEPLVAVLLLTSLATAVSAVLVAGRFGADGVFACYLALLVFFQLPSSILVFRRSRRTWHS